MLRSSRAVLVGLFFGALAAAGVPGRAHAYDVRGPAFGADAALGGPSGLALAVGLGRVELDFIVGLSMNLPDGGVLEPSFAAAAGVFFTVADSETTNFQLGGRVGGLVIGVSAGGFGGAELRSFGGLSIEFDARLEHRLDDRCAINLQVGAVANVWPDSSDPRPDLTFGVGGTGFVGGAGFRFWFDGLGGGSPSAATTTPSPAFEEAPAAPPSGVSAPSPYFQ